MRVAELNYANQEFANELVPIRRSNYKRSVKKGIEKVAKRILDICGGLVGVIGLIPLTIAIWIANRVVGDNGPVFYIQERIGKNGKLFKMYKYRSMVVGADEKLEKYLLENEEAREEYKKYKKLKEDPRITKVGKFIRKTSIDEFPQFINVLKGDMSLVGPRPYLPREREDMKYFYPYIIESKPGITGFWQISGRSEVTFEERLNMDFTYFKIKTLKLDIKVLVKTLMNVVKKEGAI
ncbi:MAG: sugar transferase [Erysipelotrichaceae bacterium]|nr:sugar transferase [Erysipelotrichaceae bacterium]